MHKCTNCKYIPICEKYRNEMSKKPYLKAASIPIPMQTAMNAMREDIIINVDCPPILRHKNETAEEIAKKIYKECSKGFKNPAT